MNGLGGGDDDWHDVLRGDEQGARGKFRRWRLREITMITMDTTKLCHYCRSYLKRSINKLETTG